VPRIAICGAGISGLTLAGILSNKLGSNVQLTVFERASQDRDQGYGLDLDEHGQEALARAGVYHRYWEISRPRSDAMGFFGLNSSITPLFVWFRPKFLQKRFPAVFAARPESNRGMLRDILMDSLEERGNATVHFETAAWDVVETKATDDGGDSSGNSTAELFDRDGGSLGEFDLVVDGMGLHSPLRQHRVHDPKGKHYEGNVMIHGTVNPENSFAPEMMGHFAPYGSYSVMGRGYMFSLQRYGGGPDDHRTSLMYVLPRDGGDEGLFAELGIAKPASREGGIMADEERLEKVRAWIKRDMDGVFDPVYHQAVDALERVTIRANYTHGHSTLREDNSSLPLICIGDSLRNCGLGGGGVLAMRDAVQLSKLLTDEEASFDGRGRASMAPVRAAEAEMLARKTEFHEQSKKQQLEIMAKRDVDNPALQWEDIFKTRSSLFWAKLLGPPASRLFWRWFQADAAAGQLGSDQSSPIYPQVQRYLDDAAAKAGGENR
jgi:2-polyprenyl-6-methoxyphenol hydroxylase-like FAD-dependent oxidoreductase